MHKWHKPTPKKDDINHITTKASSWTKCPYYKDWIA